MLSHLLGDAGSPYLIGLVSPGLGRAGDGTSLAAPAGPEPRGGVLVPIRRPLPGVQLTPLRERRTPSARGPWLARLRCSFFPDVQGSLSLAAAWVPLTPSPACRSLTASAGAGRPPSCPSSGPCSCPSCSVPLWGRWAARPSWARPCSSRVTAGGPSSTCRVSGASAGLCHAVCLSVCQARARPLLVLSSPPSAVGLAPAR